MNEVDYSVLCPTRARPGNMERLCHSIYTTATEPEKIELVFYIDDDDEVSTDKARELDKDFRITYIIGRRIVLSKMWNECYSVSSGDYLFHCGDDIVMRTPGWDTIVRDKIDEFDDKIAFVYGDDMNPGVPAEFGTHGFIHRNWAKTVGYFVPPYFSSDWNDTWLNDVAKMINRHFFVDIKTEHMHPGAGKAEYDINHRERIQRGAVDGVAERYRSLGHEREQDAKKLQEFIDANSKGDT